MGLPTDQQSIENAILATKGVRWPLMIDPQGQANRWIKNMENSRNRLKVVQLNDPDFLRVLQLAVRVGNSVLLEHIGEQLPAILEPILLKQTYLKAAQELIFLGDIEIPYHPNFRYGKKQRYILFLFRRSYFKLILLSNLDPFSIYLDYILLRNYPIPIISQKYLFGPA